MSRRRLLLLMVILVDAHALEFVKNKFSEAKVQRRLVRIKNYSLKPENSKFVDG
jgi:hypothetical protein